MKSLLLVFSLSLLPCIPQAYAQVSKPDIISVKEWGGKEPTGSIKEHEIEYITIHHAGVEMPEDADPVQKLIGLQNFSQNDKNWIDIPYHFSIDLDGKIYENRPLKYPGDTNTEYDPTGHALIQVLGNYEVQKVNEKQLESLAHLTAWLAEQYDIPTDKIATHKDYSDQTVCPGADLYKYFQDGSMIERINRYLEEGSSK